MSEPFDPYRKWLGIPPKDQPPNHYRLLAVELFEDDADIISNAADRQMAHVRTFQTGPHVAASQQLLNELAAARHCLLDRAKKAIYDQELRDRLLAAQAAQAAAAAPSPVPLAPIPIPVAPRPAPVPIPAAAPISQPYAQASPAAPQISTAAFRRRRRAWHVPVAVTMVGASLLVSIYYLVQFSREQQALSARAVAAAGQPPADAVQKHVRHEAVTGEPTPVDRPTDAARFTPAEASSPASGVRSTASKPTSSPARAKRQSPRVDLLRLIDPQRDAIKGAWRMEQGRLISPRSSTGRLAIPFRLPPEYALTIVVERQQGDGAFGVGLAAGAQKAVAAIDVERGAASGLQLVDGLAAERNDSTGDGGVLRTGEPNTLIYAVTKSRISVIANGKTVVDFQGEFSRLAWPPNYGDPIPERLELLASADARFVIERLDLTVVADPEKLAGPIRETKPDRSAPEKTPPREERKTLGGLLGGPAIKADPPSEAELTKAERQARELFRNELANAKLPEQKKAFAQALLDRGADAESDPAERFVLLRLAGEVAAEGGQAVTAMAAVDELARWFDVDSVELKLEALSQANKGASAPQLKQELVKAAVELIDRSVDEDAYASAIKAANIAQTAARALKDLRRTKEIADKKREAERFAKAYAAISDSLARLEADGADAEANLEVGKFYCLVKQQWDRGLPLLARGSNGACQSLAQRDLQQPDSAEGQKELADEWWSLAQTEKGPAKTAIVNRAVFWYRRAAPGLSGLEREMAEKRIKETDSSAAGVGANVVFLADMTEAELSSDNNRLEKGRDDGGKELTVNGQPSPKGLMLQPPKNGVGGATYIINKKFRLFTADVGVNPFPNDASATPLVFELVGDGALLWRSQPIARPDQTDHCEVTVSKVVNLQLRVFCPGSNFGAKAVWIEPRLTSK